MPKRDVPPGAAEVWVILPQGAGGLARMRELWRFRHLLRFFGTRALEKHYRRTVLGVLWLLLRPTIPILLVTVVFGNLIGVKSGQVPYVLFFLVGSTSWLLFSSSLLWVTRSLELNRKLVKKLYFPRLILPLAMLLPAIVEFAIHVAMMCVVVVYFAIRDDVWYVSFGFGLLWSVGAALIAMLFALGIGLWTAVLGAKARDVRFTLGYVLQFWYFLTPVIYPSSLIPERWRFLADLNPMAAVIDTFKWGTLGVDGVRLSSLVFPIAAATVAIITGLWFFHRAEAATIDRL